MDNENQLTKQRKEKLNYLKKQGINPYAYSFDKKNNSKNILDKFKKLKKGELTKTKVSIAGRIMTLRAMGKASFAHIQDNKGRIQIYITQDNVGKRNYNLFKKLDIGDIIGVKGIVFKTKLGETSIKVNEIKLLTKSLIPLPEKWHGLKDTELRYRQRYLDLIVNPKVKEIFIKRSKIIQAIREFLVKKGFTEVETPILQPVYGGTNARPFKSYLNDLKMNVYMRISNELYLKKLIVGGYEKIFEFSIDFRNEGIDATHNPEFLLMETMWAYADYMDNMDLFEEMIEYIAKKVFGTMVVDYQGKKFNFKRPWKRMTMIESIKKFAKIDVNKLNEKELKKILKKNKIEYKNDWSWGHCVNALFEEIVEEKLIQPTIIYDFPKESCPLAKIHRENPRLVERFEPYVNGWEMGNVYTELNDPEILRKNWEEQEKQYRKGDVEAQKIDKDFLRALEIGMPPTSGLGIGVDRWVMLFTNSPSIKEVIMFPFMKQ
jgi:lysyl-tRNA synthetase class 2